MEEKIISASRPWAGPDALYTEDMLHRRRMRERGDGKSLTERMKYPGKKEKLKLIYRALKDNEYMTSKELKAIIGEKRSNTKAVKNLIDTLDDFIPIWEDCDSNNRYVVWFGLLDRSRVIEELE